MLALVVLASASFNVAYAAKKKKKKAEETVQPVQLASPSDSLSYVVGMVMTNGLIPYLQQAEGVDTAYMADFIRGFNEMIKSGDDPKVKAYSAGMGIAARLKGQMLEGMKKEFTDTPDTIVAPLVYRGFTDALQGDTTVMKADEAEAAFKAKREYNKAAKDEKLYGPNREAGKQFLAENAKKDSVVTLPSGLQYKVLKEGNGNKPKATDKVKCHYEGFLIDGTVFDSSIQRGEPAVFPLNQVIAGWTEGLQLMQEGAKYRFFIPYQLGYGERGAGASIPPFATLVFDVELIEVM